MILIINKIVMYLSMVLFGAGTIVMAGRWIKCLFLGIKFPRFPKLLFFLGLFATFIPVLFIYDTDELVLEYMFSLCGIIYLISVIWVQQQKEDL